MKLRRPEANPELTEQIKNDRAKIAASYNACSECHREIDPSGESLTKDQYWICQTCALKVTVMPGAVIVPLLRPVYKKMTISVEEHVYDWLKSHPREKASWIVRDTVESKIS